MVPKVIIRDLSPHRIYRTSIKCVRCSFWFDQELPSFLDEVMGINRLSDLGYIIRKRFSKRSYPQKKCKKLAVFSENGGIVKGAFINKRCTGILIAGNPELFPRLQAFRVYPPDHRCTFLGCIYVEPDMRDYGIESRLLLELEKDLLKKNEEAIEAIGKRLDDDIEIEEFENSPLVSFKFLIKNGFYLKKNDEQYPLLRLDLKSISRGTSREELSMGKLAYKKTARQPVIMRENDK